MFSSVFFTQKNEGSSKKNLLVHRAGSFCT